MKTLLICCAPYHGVRMLVGLNLFFASYRFGKPVMVALAAGVLVITYLPWLSTALPGLRP